jgi:hypothetical protein
MQTRARERTSTVEALKEVIVFLAALTFTNAIATLLFEGGTIRSLWGTTKEQWACFFFLLFGVVRFYLGNYRFLDNSYKISPVISAKERRNILWFDFACVLSVALGFAVLGYFINDFSKFVIIYSAIIFLDVLWLGVTTKGPIVRWDRSAGIQLRVQGVTWFWNNVGHLVVFALVSLVCVAASAIAQSNETLKLIRESLVGGRFQDNDWVFYGMVAFLFTNAIFDIYFNRKLYFPPEADDVTFDAGTKYRIFLAAPFTQNLRPKGQGGLPEDYRRGLSKIIELFEAKNCSVSNAHKREVWGERLDDPASALRYDLEGVALCDVLVAIIGLPPSPGVQLEIGYAIALHKPIVVIHQRDQFIPYLIRGLGSSVPATILTYERESEISGLLKNRFFS